MCITDTKFKFLNLYGAYDKNIYFNKNNEIT